jgi:sodium/potassium-transporting ATPase subunit alpha
VLFVNLKRVITYLLPAGSWSEMLPAVANVFLGMPLPLSSFYMICICMSTDVFGAISLIYTAPERDVMDLLPRNVKTDRLVNRELFLYAYAFTGMIQSSSIACYML